MPSGAILLVGVGLGQHCFWPLNADPLDGGAVHTGRDLAPPREARASILPALGWYFAVVYAIAISASLGLQYFELNRPIYLMPTIIGAGAWVACKKFVGRHCREMSRGEFWRLVLSSYALTLPYEALAVPVILEAEFDHAALFFIVVAALVLEFISVLLAFWYIGRRAISRHLAAV